jgi:hypothetical protein
MEQGPHGSLNMLTILQFEKLYYQDARPSLAQSFVRRMLATRSVAPRMFASVWSLV